MSRKALAMLLALVLTIALIPAAFATSSLSDYFAGLPVIAETEPGYPNSTKKWTVVELSGQEVLRSGNKNKPYSTSTLQLTFTQATPCSFEYKVSTENNYDWVTITLNGTQISKESGNLAWKTYEFNAAQGDVLKIVCSKDSSGNAYDDCVYVRNIACGASCVVTFHANGGEGADYTQTISGGSGVLQANSFVYSGKIFAGWATSANGDVVYADGAAIEATANIDLYAVWVNACTVTFDYNDDGATANTTITVAQNATLTASQIPAPSRDGYSFMGWYNGDVQLTTETAISADVTYTARWASAGAVNYQNVLDEAFDAAGALYNPANNAAIDKANVTSDIHTPTTRDLGVITMRDYGKGFDGKYTPIVITSSNNDVIEQPDVPNAARVTTYRPLPGRSAENVTLTVKIYDRPNGPVDGQDVTTLPVLASKTINLTVQPMTQAEINAAAAQMQSMSTEEVYWNGIKKANSDKNNVTGDLYPFVEILAGDDGYTYVRDLTEKSGLGVETDEIPGWYNSQQYRCFRSSDPTIITHENMLVTRPTYDTYVTIDSVLSYTEYAKYWEKNMGNAAYRQFEQFYKQPISITVKVKGTTATLLGDVNRDGSVTTVDGALVYQYYLGTIASGAVFDTGAADVNGDGMITVADAALICNYSNGILDAFPTR